MKNLTSSFEPQQFISIPYQQILAAPNNTVCGETGETGSSSVTTLDKVQFKMDALYIARK